MPTLPKILIIDDQFGGSLLDRRDLCALYGLSDITGDDSSPKHIDPPIAEAVFCTGQAKSANAVENSAPVAMEAIERGWPSPAGWRWALILLDLRFKSGVLDASGEPKGREGDDIFGLEILDGVHRSHPDIPVVIISSRERKVVIEGCRRRGAKGFIQRVGFGQSEVSPKELLSRQLNDYGLMADTRIQHRIAGTSVSIMQILSAARRAATGTGNILLLGETGTGKELFARYIHDLSPKNNGPYVVFHGHGTAETLQEDELFGHAKGAHSTATSVRKGIFEEANGGTLFIDELGDIPEGLQNKLMRPIAEREVNRQGDSKKIPLDVQIILATNKNLDDHARNGKFKQDLLNRVSANPIWIPPLRERKEDIPLIADQWLKILCQENNARTREIKPDALDKLVNHDWPGNVRGLRNVLERAVKDHKDSELLIADDIRLDEPSRSAPQSSPMASSAPLAPTLASTPVPSYVEGELEGLLKAIEDFKFQQDYSKLQGKLPHIQKAVATLLCNYLLAAVDVTKKRRAGSADEELNITGAASCMAGEQLPTLKAADLIKKLLQHDEKAFKNLAIQHPLLREIYDEALRLRPKQPKGKRQL